MTMATGTTTAATALPDTSMTAMDMAVMIMAMITIPLARAAKFWASRSR